MILATRTQTNKQIILSKETLQVSIEGMQKQLKKVRTYARRQRLEHIMNEMEYLKTYYYERA